jgi:membrane-bound lytic murein transglycosylase D
LVTVADRFNITVQQLRRWNHLTAARLQPGRRLYVAEPASVTRSGKTKQPASPTAKRKAPARATSATHANAKNGKET